MATPARQSGYESGVPLGRLFGIPIYLDASWFILFLLIAVTLAIQFRSQHPHWSAAQQWILGIVTSLLFLASLLFHEVSHSLVAKHYKLPVQSITLFVFGGLSRIARDPDNARQEFNVAIAGPLASFFVAGCFWLIWRFVSAGEMVHTAAFWLAWSNGLLALFNLLPGFPLDGGRVLRSLVWGFTRDFTRATRIAAMSGKFFAYAMIAVGLWQALNGNWVGGLWLAFIGWFLLSAAQESYAHVALRNMLSGVSARDIMTTDVPTVPREMSIEEYVQDVFRTGRRCHVAVAGEEPVGLITLATARSVPRDEWQSMAVQAVMLPAEKIHWATPEEPALGVLQRMQSQDINQMPVISDHHIVGMISRDTILRVLQTRLQLNHST
ncbi:MAG TPA: site-2 protease family protein [Candidatus Acidoferrales bacterium]|nr:site-2 protease family protein [Candidatus Acidoferrales bacterium]